jgi:hypothetical protein
MEQESTPPITLAFAGAHQLIKPLALHAKQFLFLRVKLRPGENALRQQISLLLYSGVEWQVSSAKLPPDGFADGPCSGLASFRGQRMAAA